MGTLSARSPPTPQQVKPLPRASGPSESRLASQEYIHKTSTKQGEILGTAIKTDHVKSEFVPTNRVTRVSHKLVKEEPNIRLVHRTEKLMGPERVIHPSGKLCKSSNKGGYYDDELPDLPSVPAQIPDSRTVQTLHSPPTVRRSTSRQLESTGSIPPADQVSDVLSGYIIDNSLAVTTQHITTPVTRAVQTPRVEQTVSDVLSGYVYKTTQVQTMATSSTMGTPISPIKPPELTRVVETTETQNVTIGQLEVITPDVDLLEPTNESRVVTTDHLDELEQAEITAAANRNAELHLLLDDDQENSRVVATSNNPIVREQTEIDAAETLLQLRDTDTADTSQDDNKEPANDLNPDTMDMDTPVDNEVLLPVDAPMLEDFAKGHGKKLRKLLI